MSHVIILNFTDTFTTCYRFICMLLKCLSFFIDKYLLFSCQNYRHHISVPPMISCSNSKYCVPPFVEKLIFFFTFFLLLEDTGY